MVVHRGKDLVEHHKLAPRGEKCVYLGCGNAYGRRAYIAYSPHLHRVFSTIHAQFDESFFPFRTVDQRVRGRNDNTAQLETLSLYHDMLNATISDITERIKSNSVPCKTEWTLSDLMSLPATMHPSTPNSGDSGDGAHASSSDQSARSDYDSLGNINNVTLLKLKESVFVHDRPEPYASLQQSWKAAGKKMTGEVSTTELAEYLIGIEAKIKCPPYYWPKYKCSWTVMCMEHEEDGRAKGGHRFKVLLMQSHPPYKDKSGHKPACLVHTTTSKGARMKTPGTEQQTRS
jgi:hypothetical protein